MIIFKILTNSRFHVHVKKKSMGLNLQGRDSNYVLPAESVQESASFPQLKCFKVVIATSGGRVRVPSHYWSLGDYSHWLHNELYDVPLY